MKAAADQKQIKEQARKQAERTRLRYAALRGLETNLKNRGYNLSASFSLQPREMLFIPPDFSRTEHRIAVLSLIRDNNDGVCRAGLRAIRLERLQPWFEETYPLDCPFWSHCHETSEE